MGGVKRTFDTLIGNDSDSKVRQHQGSEAMPPRLSRTSNRTMSSRVRTAEHNRTTAHRRQGTPHLEMCRLVQPDRLPTVQNISPDPNVFARDPRHTQHQLHLRDSRQQPPYRPRSNLTESSQPRGKAAKQKRRYTVEQPQETICIPERVDHTQSSVAIHPLTSPQSHRRTVQCSRITPASKSHQTAKRIARRVCRICIPVRT